MNTEKTIDALNKLVEINNDRFEGYQTAVKESEDEELRALFQKFAKTSEENRRELAQEITTLGGTPTDDTKISGKFFRAWMDVKAAFTGNDRKAILDSCEYGEDQALATYKDVMEEEVEWLNSAHQTMINNQYTALKTDHDVVKSMRDALELVS